MTQIPATKGSCRHQDDVRFSAGVVLKFANWTKRELIGNFKNTAAKWNRSPVRVNDHDFRSDASGVGISYGMYDTPDNRGTVFSRSDLLDICSSAGTRPNGKA